MSTLESVPLVVKTSIEGCLLNTDVQFALCLAPCAGQKQELWPLEETSWRLIFSGQSRRWGNLQFRKKERGNSYSFFYSFLLLMFVFRGDDVKREDMAIIDLMCQGPPKHKI